jgi:membrane-associated phospholipid phosphatase
VQTTATPATDRRRIGFVPTITICVAVVLGITVFGLIIARNGAYTAWDTQLLAHLAATRVPSLVDVSLAVDRIFSPPFAAVIGVVSTAIVFLVTRTWATVIHFVLLVAGTWLGSEVVKVIVHRPRPIARIADTLVPNPDPDSYPSGHVCFAVGLGFAVFVLLAGKRVRMIIAVLAVVLALGTALTRVYLGVHYPTDVVASLVYAAAAFIGLEALWRRFGGIFSPRRRAHAA